MTFRSFVSPDPERYLLETEATTVFQELSQTRFAEGLAAHEVKLIAEAGRRVQFPAGAILFSEGGQKDEVFVILDGHVGLEMHVPRRGNVRLLTAGPGDLVGWSGLLGDGPMTATAVTTETTRLVSFSSGKLRELCSRNHELGYVLMTQTARAIAQRVLVTRLQLLDLFAETEPTARPSRDAL